MQAERAVFNVRPSVKWTALLLVAFLFAAVSVLAVAIAHVPHERHFALAIFLPLMMLAIFAGFNEARFMWFRDRVEVDDATITYVRHRLRGERRRVLRWEEITDVRNDVRHWRTPRVELRSSDPTSPPVRIEYTLYAGAEDLLEAMSNRRPRSAQADPQMAKLPRAFPCSPRPFRMRAALSLALVGPTLITLCVASSGEVLGVALAGSALYGALVAYAACRQPVEMTLNDDSIAFREWWGIKRTRHFSSFSRMVAYATPFGPIGVRLWPAKGCRNRWIIRVDESCLDDPADPCRAMIAAWEAWTAKNAKCERAASGKTERPALDARTDGV